MANEEKLVVAVSKTRLVNMLKDAYEQGCDGTLELAEATAVSLAEKCIQDLAELTKSQAAKNNG